jgi:hypothetical protein
MGLKYSEMVNSSQDASRINSKLNAKILDTFSTSVIRVRVEFDSELTRQFARKDFMNFYTRKSIKS